MDKKKIHVTREYEKKMSEISPFELKNILIELADESARKSTHIMLNAGRGNPNWISTVPREAFFLLGQFAWRNASGKPNWQMRWPEPQGSQPQKDRVSLRTVSKETCAISRRYFIEGTYEYLVTEKV